MRVRARSAATAGISGLMVMPALSGERWAAPEAVTLGDRGILTRGPHAGPGDLGWTVGEGR